MTFYEAKKLGTSKHKEYGDDWGAWNHENFIKEMDKKVWKCEQ
ncbi:hypothetical protein [Clostridium pasteurianum]|nr:hypothetical protein [Clostridium pasteurianum]